MVTEKFIDHVIQELEESAVYNEKIKALAENNPSIVSYLESEGFEILTSDERDLLWYLTVVVIESVKESGLSIRHINVKEIETAEENNYTSLESEHMRFSEMADLLFDGYPQEDLLAFIEDTVIPDEENFPSPVGRKVIFMTMKTIIDVLTGLS